MAVLSGIAWRVIAVEDLQALQADVDKGFEKAGKFRSTLRKSHGVSQRRHASTFNNLLNSRFKAGFVAFDRGLGLIGEVEIEGLLHACDVALIAKHSREMWAANLVATVVCSFIERNWNAELLQFSDQFEIASTTAFLLTFKPTSEFAGWRRMQPISEQMNGRLSLSSGSRFIGSSAQFDGADEFQSAFSSDGQRGIVTREGIVIGDCKRFDALANSEASEICGIGGAVGPVGVCVQVDQLALRRYLLGAEYMSGTRKLR